MSSGSSQTSLEVFVKGSDLATSLGLPKKESEQERDTHEGRDELAVASFEWLKQRPKQFVMLTLSCFLYSLVGLNLLMIWDEVEFHSGLFGHGVLWPRFIRLYSYGIVLQGILSFLGDIFAPYVLWRRDSILCTIDIIAALFNTGMGISCMSSVKLPAGQQEHLSTLCNFFVVAVCTTFPLSVISFRQRNFQVWVWAHTMWHLIPCSIAFTVLRVMVKQPIEQ